MGADMKFAKILLLTTLLSPSVAMAQETANLSPLPTNFTFLVPFVLSTISLPLLFSDKNDVLPILPPPAAPIPVVSTR